VAVAISVSVAAGRVRLPVNGATWVQEGKLLPSDLGPSYLFGRNAFMGATGDSPAGVEAGSAYFIRLR